MKKNLKGVISFAIALALSLSSVAALAKTEFPDVPVDAKYAAAVNNLSALGIVKGDDTGNFRPDDKITRAEVAAMVIRAMNNEAAAQSSMGATSFSDVAADHWASGYINLASKGAEAFINGMGDGTFAPEANVTYAQIVKMLVSAIGYDSLGQTNGGYPTGYLSVASSFGMTDGISNPGANEEVSRALVAQLIDNALDTPVMEIKEWVNGQPTYQIKNGTGKDWQTVLTEKWNIYSVEGRVTGTHKTGACDDDQVKLTVEVAKNFDDQEYSRKLDNADTFSMYLGETEADKYLQVYSSALVREEAGEYTLISITPSGKNETVEDIPVGAFDSDNTRYDQDHLANSIVSEGALWFYKDEAKTGSATKYKLETDNAGNVTAEVYVNGKKADADLSDVLDQYLLNNTTGFVTLVDSPSSSSSSPNGNYDYIFITTYKIAVVSDVDETTINFAYYDGDIDSTIDLDTDKNDDLKYTITMDGKEIAVTDLQEDDVLAIAYDVIDAAKFRDSDYYDILVSRKTVEGKVTQEDWSGWGDTEGDGYEIDGQFYKPSYEDAGYLTSGEEYTLYLDPFGKYARYESLASSKKFAILDNAYLSESGDAVKVKLILATGETVTYEADEKKFGSSLSDAADKLKALVYDGGSDKVAVEKRVVEYKTNSSDVVTRCEVVNGTGSSDPKEYDADRMRFGSVRMDETTKILNANDPTDISTATLSGLKDEAEYVVYGFDKSNDGISRFVVIISDGSGITKDTRLAAYSNISSGVNPDTDDTCDYINVVGAAKNKYVLEDGYDVVDNSGTSVTLSKGDVIILETNTKGEVTKVTKLFDNTDTYTNYIGDFMNGGTFPDSFILPDAWTNPSDNIELAFGAITEKNGSRVVLSSVSKDGDAFVSKYDDRWDVTCADDVNVMVYDFSESKANRLKTGTAGSIKAKSVKSATDDNADQINWDQVSESTLEKMNYAFAKVVDDEITDIFVILAD